MQIVRTCTNLGKMLCTLGAFFLLCTGNILPQQAYAQEKENGGTAMEESPSSIPEYTPNEYVLGKITGIIEEGTEDMGGFEDA